MNTQSPKSDSIGHNVDQPVGPSVRPSARPSSLFLFQPTIVLGDPNVVHTALLEHSCFLRTCIKRNFWLGNDVTFKRSLAISSASKTRSNRIISFEFSHGKEIRSTI